MRTVPDMHKAVKWNQPFYGHEVEGWLLTPSAATRSTSDCRSLAGTSLDPVPPKASKRDEARYVDIDEDDDLDEDKLVSWIQDACNLPGEDVQTTALDVPIVGRPLAPARPNLHAARPAYESAIRDDR